jgi:hypothetical protein
MSDVRTDDLPDGPTISRLTEATLTHTQALTVRWLLIEERRPSNQREHVEPSIPKRHPFRLNTLRALEDLNLIEPFETTEKKKFTRSNGRSVVPTGHVRTVKVTRWRLTQRARKLLAAYLPKSGPVSRSGGFTLEEAQDHVALVRDQDALAHQISAACAKAFGLPLPIALLAKRYKAQAKTIAAFQARAKSSA